MIDICDYAVGLSRQLFGLTLATERAPAGEALPFPRPRRLNVAAAVSLAGIGFVAPGILAALRQPLGS
jgi:hypothetical protein